MNSRQLWSIDFPSFIVTSLTVLLGVAAIRAYAGTFYAGQPLDVLLSWSGQDEPGFRIRNYEAEPIWGVHYFGDLQEHIAWARSIWNGVSPYDFKANHPPLALVSALPLLLVETKIAVPLLLSVFGLILVFVWWILLRGCATPLRLQTLVVAGLVTTPTLSMLDRGNAHLVVAVLVGLGLILVNARRIYAASIVVGVSIAFKLSPLLLLLFPLARRQWRIPILAISVSLTVTIAAAFVLPGGVFQAISGLTGGILEFTGEAVPSKNYSSTGLVVQMANVVGGNAPHLVEDWKLWITVALGLTWIVGVVLIIPREREFRWVTVVLVLATVQMVPPISYPYVLWWASFCAMVLVSRVDFSGRMFKRETSSVWQGIQLVACTAIVVTLSPLALEIGVAGVPIGIQAVMSPLALWVLLLSALLMQVRSRRTSRGLPAPQV